MSQSLKIFPYKNNGLVDVKNNRLVNLATPVDDNDAVTKVYVDSALVGANDPEALKSYALVADNQADITYPSQRSAEYTCVKVNTETITTSSVLPLGSGTNANIYDQYLHNGKLYVCGRFTTVDGISSPKIAIWDLATESWSSIGAPSTSFNIGKILVDANDNVYAADTLDMFNFSGNPRLHKYDASTETWSTLTFPTGFSSQPPRSSHIDSNGHVYLVLNNNSNIKYLYKYDGSSFSLVADFSSISSYQYMNVTNIDSTGTIYIGGNFGLRKLNGSTWEPVGDRYISGVEITNILFDANNYVYVSGYNQNVSYYNGSTWTSLGSGVEGGDTDNNSIAFDENGNIFTLSNYGSYVYKWTASTQTWSTYHYDASHNYDKCVYYNGLLYVTGNIPGYIGAVTSSTNTTSKMITLNAPSGYAFVDVNNNSYAPTSVTFYAVGNYFKVLYSVDDDTYYTVNNTL
jgi:hypothetical protein